MQNGSWSCWTCRGVNRPEVLSSGSDKAKLLKTFLRNLIFMTQVSLYLFSLLELIQNYIFLQLLRWLKMSKSVLICQKHLILIVFQWWFWRTVSLNFWTFLHVFFFNWDSFYATTRHGVTWKEVQKILQDTENLFRKNLQLKEVC